MKRSSIARTTLFLLPAQIFFRVGEALLPLLLAAWFGRTKATDVYYFSWAIFTFAGSLGFSVFQDSSLVPVLAELKVKDPKSVPIVTGSLLTHTLTWGSTLAFVIGVAAFGYFQFRYDGVERGLAQAMVVPFSFFLVALSVRSFLTVLLNVDHVFFASPLASFGGMATTIGLIATLRARLGVLAIPVGSLAGEVVAVAVLSSIAFGACKMKFKLSFARPEAVRIATKLMASEVGGSAVTRINPVIDQLMAGLAGVVGGSTLLRYSMDVASLPTSILQAALLPVLLSHMSDDFAAARIAAFRRTVMRALVTACGVLLAASALLFLIRAPLLRLVFLRGEMDSGGVDRMIRLLPYSLIGLAPFGALLILVRAHVAIRNSGIMIQMGILNAALNTVLNVVLLRVMGLEGIALSTSLMQAVVALVFFWRLEAKLDRIRLGLAPSCT